MTKLYIGLDVHKEKTVIAVAYAGREDAEHYGKCSSDILRLTVAIRKLPSANNEQVCNQHDTEKWDRQIKPVLTVRALA